MCLEPASFVLSVYPVILDPFIKCSEVMAWRTLERSLPWKWGECLHRTALLSLPGVLHNCAT